MQVVDFTYAKSAPKMTCLGIAVVQLLCIGGNWMESKFYFTLIFNCLHNCVIQLVICFISRNLRIFSLDSIRALEQESCFTCLDHAKVVVAVTAGNGVVANGLQGFHSGVFGLFAAHFEISNFAIFAHYQCVAEDGRIAQLTENLFSNTL